MLVINLFDMSTLFSCCGMLGQVGWICPPNPRALPCPLLSFRCDVTTGVFQDPFALQGKAVVVLEDEAQCVHPSSQLLRHVQIAGGKALLYVPTKVKHR